MFFYFDILSDIIYSCDAKLNFHHPLLQSSVSHVTSQFILICFIYYLLSTMEIVFAASLKKKQSCNLRYFFHYSLMNKKF